MTKASSIVVVILLFYVLPLLGKAGLVLHPQILILVAACSLLFWTQPAISLNEADAQKEIDKNSVFVILIATALSQITAVVEWAYFHDQSLLIQKSTLISIGLALLIGGISLRLWAILTLGRYFTATVQVRDGQKIVTTGPYAIVRHPSYLGAYVAILGSAIFLQAQIGFVVSALLMFLAYRFRIQTEEQVLVGAYGEVYQDYQLRTRRMIPFVW